MSTYTYFSVCSVCHQSIEIEVVITPGQNGGLETEYLPESFEVEDLTPCTTQYCGHKLTDAEVDEALTFVQQKVGEGY